LAEEVPEKVITQSNLGGTCLGACAGFAPNSRKEGGSGSRCRREKCVGKRYNGTPPYATEFERKAHPLVGGRKSLSKTTSDSFRGENS